MKQHRGPMTGQSERAVDARAETELAMHEQPATGPAQVRRSRPVQHCLPPLRRLTNPQEGYA